MSSRSQEARFAEAGNVDQLTPTSDKLPPWTSKSWHILTKSPVFRRRVSVDAALFI
jgi:hypothetical protein